MDFALTQVTALIGSVTGIVGLCLSLFNVLLDRTRLSLAAYREPVVDGITLKVKSDDILVVVANGGRRPVIIVSVTVLQEDGPTHIAGIGYQFAGPHSAERLPQILNPPHFIVVRLPTANVRANKLSAILVEDSLGTKHRVPRKFLAQITQQLSDIPYAEIGSAHTPH